jgi:hypothetical protein
MFFTGGLKASGISTLTKRRPPKATRGSYKPYNEFEKNLLFDSRFGEHDGGHQLEILALTEQEFFEWLNDIRYRRIRIDHDKKREMFWTIAGRILDKYVSELSSASNAFDASEASEAEDEMGDQTFAGAKLLPPISSDQYLEKTKSEISALVAACAPDSGDFFPWEVKELPMDLSE